MSFLATVAVASLINITADNLGYGGVMLGATRASVERTLGRVLPPTKQAHPYPFCGSYESITYIGGNRVKIQWSDRTPDSTAEIIEVTLPEPLRERIPGVVPVSVKEEGKAAFFPSRSRKVILGTYNGNDREPPGLVVAEVGCMD